MARENVVRFVVRASSLAVGLLVAQGAAAQTPPPPQSGVTATSPAAASNLVLVHLDTPSDVDLEQDFGGGHWRVVCESPCDRPLETNRQYRINGLGVRASHPFEISPGQKVTIEVDPASSLSTGVGIAVTVIGVAGLAPGAGVTVAVVGGVLLGAIFACPFVAAFTTDKTKQSSAYSNCVGGAASLFGQAYASPYVWIPAIVGGVGIAAGVTLLATSSRTTVRQSTPVTASEAGMPEMWRAPVWHDNATLRYPAAATSQIVDLSF